ncbi:lantibiotic dehydratase family protein [Aquimarina pacifica]|uniref:lantibiotic dehydratase family protein n=1 Tax=Aquimarina pacifica TaxID=1296415 RepID=UPI00046F2E64|nr:lantibiotic dehydratase family protein [Aquimarina pacifica]
MKQKNPYTFFDVFCLRTPLLPLNFYFDLTKENEISTKKLKEIWSNDTIKEAIFLASPELFSEIDKWLLGDLKDKKKIQRLQFSLLKYLSRMSSRCTPFGLFAGCSMGHFSKSTHIELKPHTDNQRQTRFDMNFLVAFSQKLSKEEAIKKQLKWYPNNSLYKIGNQYRYVEYTYDSFNRRQHSIEAVTHTSYLEIILQNCEKGKKISEIAELLIDDEISLEEAEDFIYQLIDNQILVSELEPSVTGMGFLSQINNCLKRIKNTTELVSKINHFQEFLNTIDQTLGNATHLYKENSEKVKELNVDFELKYLFQTDMYPKLLSNELDIQIAYKIGRVMTLFNKLSLPPKNTDLHQFKNAFVKRYETREIPLAKVLDIEVGIGYIQNREAADHTPFLEDLHIPQRKNDQTTSSWNPILDILNKKLQEITKSNDPYTLQLHDQDFENFDTNWNDLPDTMSSMGELVLLNGQRKIIVSSMGGTSAANLLGRFSTGNTEIKNHVQNIAEIEQKIEKNKLLAEIVHLPESRTGNVIRREAIRNYEIPYLGKSNLSAEKQIPIEDLMVSVQYDKIILRSKKYNQEILPKLTNAHNYKGKNALPIYNFLCDMQQQNIRSAIGFSWGELLEKNTFLPRVEYKEFILSKARWKITKDRIEFLLTDFTNNKDILTAITDWRDLLKIPRYVQLIDFDNTLLIDLGNVSSIRMFLDIVKNRYQFIVEEFLFTEESLVKENNNNYTNQFVFSFYNAEKLATSTKACISINSKDTQNKKKRT